MMQKKPNNKEGYKRPSFFKPAACETLKALLPILRSITIADRRTLFQYFPNKQKSSKHPNNHKSKHRGRALPEWGDEKEDDHRGGRARRRTQQSDRTAQPEQRGRRGEKASRRGRMEKSPSLEQYNPSNCRRSERRHLN